MSIDSSKQAFFDSIAEQWDSWESAPEVLGANLDAGLAEFGIGAGETIVDLGCGTGNLTLALLRRLSPSGRVFAVDLSPGMLTVAARKVTDPRVKWHCADALSLPFEDASIDRILCYSVWPHFSDALAVTRELKRVLRPLGWLHVWHLISRDKVNQIHQQASPAVHDDVLVEASALAVLLQEQGFGVHTCIDDDARYLISACRSGSQTT